MMPNAHIGAWKERGNCAINNMHLLCFTTDVTAMITPPIFERPIMAT